MAGLGSSTGVFGGSTSASSVWRPAATVSVAKSDRARSSSSGSLSGSSLSGTSTLDGYLNRLQAIQSANNAWSAAQAQKQMDFQKQSAADAMKFNKDEAQISRQWQEYMSNTAHQREIKDLQAAGLNPVLSAMGGSGAPVTSGATASGYTSQGAKGDTDTSLAPALVSLLGSAMQAQASMANTLTSARSQEEIAKLGYQSDIVRALMSASSAREVANIQGTTSRDVANIQGDSSRDVAAIQGLNSQIVASINADATRDSAKIHAAAQTAAAQISGQYGLSIAQTNQVTAALTTSMRIASNEGIAAANRNLQRQLQGQGYKFDLALQEDKQSHELKINSQNLAVGTLNNLLGILGRLVG